jgi:uncharacterized protein YjbI with pentapeptide repeats
MNDHYQNMSSDPLNARSQLSAIRRQGGRACNFDLHDADLYRADLSGLGADRVDLRTADLRDATLRGARLGNCRAEQARFEGSDWTGATLRMCALDDAHGAEAFFDGARIEDSTVTGADLSRASLRGAHLTETSFARAVMREVALDDAEGEGVEFRGADLGGATLIGARFDEADFRGADLRGADLARGRFRCADFRGALLDGARFDDADCAGALFDEGAGPHASAPNAGEKRDQSFDRVIASALREVLTSLPTIVATDEVLTPDLHVHLQRAVNTLAAASHAPEEWKPWLDRLIKLSSGEKPADSKAVLNALFEGPTALRDVLASQDGHTAKALLQRSLERLNAASDQPPEEWKPLLEPLMDMTTGKGPLDLKILLKALSALDERKAPNPGETKPS